MEKMLGTTYEQQRDNTLERYCEFIKVIQGLPTAINKRINLANLEEKVGNIKRNKFTLMVVGEAKSGKSTFINAYLKTDILPMSVEQCTSAIIEITYSEEKKLTYYTADGRKFYIEGDQKIRDFLNENAALNSMYRKIPVASLNEIITFRKGNVPSSEIEDTIRTLADDNIYELSQNEYADAIRQYFKEHIGKWKDIVVKLIISYPFAPEMKDIRIIDSPGVNALGQVGEITENYIESANAIVFIKCLTGQALETKSFKKFLKSKNAGRHEESLFVLLSRASDHKPADLETLVSKARLMYSSNIKQEKIIPIDSLVQFYINRFQGKTECEISKILDDEYNQGNGFSWVDSKWNRRTSIDVFLSDMAAMSGFQEINKNFELYAKQAQRLALYELLNELNKNYGKLEGLLRQEIDLSKKKMTYTPEALAFEIHEHQNTLDELRKELNQSIFEIENRYTSGEGVIYRKKLEVVASVRSSLAASEIDSLEREITKITDPLKRFKESLALSVIADCNETLKVMCKDHDFETWMTDILVPDFPLEEVKKIQDAVKKDDEIYDECTKGWTYKETHRSLNRDKYIEKVKNSIINRLENMATTAEAEITAFVETIFGKYRDKLKQSIEEEQGALQEKLEAKETAEKLAEIILQYTAYVDSVVKNRSALNCLMTEVNDGIKK